MPTKNKDVSDSIGYKLGEFRFKMEIEKSISPYIADGNTRLNVLMEVSEVEE